LARGMLARRSALCWRPLQPCLRTLATQRFPVPAMGDSITEGTILELTKKVGDYVAMEEVLAMVETDKVTVEVRSPAAGTVTALLTGPDETVLVGAEFIEIDVGVGQPGAAADGVAAPAPAMAPSPVAAAPAISNTRIHPSGKPSLISFPPRGVAAVAAAASRPPPAAAAMAPAAAPTAVSKPPPGGVIAYADLPARFRRQPLSPEEMDAIDMGGAGYIF